MARTKLTSKLKGQRTGGTGREPRKSLPEMQKYIQECAERKKTSEETTAAEEGSVSDSDRDDSDESQASADDYSPTNSTDVSDM